MKKTTKKISSKKQVKAKSKPARTKKNASAKSPKSKKKQEISSKESEAEAILEKTPGAKFPSKIKPMLATLVDKPFDKEDWVYEVKWDGYRSLALLNKGNVELKSRNDKSFNDKFYPVARELSTLKLNVVLDGEIVVVNEKGMADFGALQNWRSEADGHLLFYIFDILWLNGKDLTGLSFKERRIILHATIREQEIIKISDLFEESGTSFFETAKKMGLEGVIAKKINSPYSPGNRSKDWLKVKANQRQEMVIGGYTINDNTSKPFSSLLMGVFDKDQLIYKGKVGTGFKVKDQKEMLTQFKKLEVKKPPFKEIPDVNKPSRFRPDPPHASVTWLKPDLVCEVSFAEMTSDGVMRHPSFQGMREDKEASSVVLERPRLVHKILSKSEKIAELKIISPAGKNPRKTLLNPKDETQVRKLNGHELKFTNLSKIFWPDEKITKRDMLNYYYQVAPYILPYLKNRPQSMNRHPDGITGKSFYYKDITGRAPDWLETYLYHSEADGRDRKYLVATNEASLLYMASLGCIEMNPWSSTVQKEDYPDWCIIDLDPAKKTTFEKVIEAALVTKDILDAMNIPSFPKTSGSTGIHIYIPLGAKYIYEQSKEFARVIAHLVNEQIPSFTSIERIVKDRKGKMYIDFLQNRPQATVSAPYSLRPRPGATVSMPLHWSEVRKGMKMQDFNIFNAIERINDEGDLFKPVLGKGIDLEKIVGKF